MIWFEGEVVGSFWSQIFMESFFFFFRILMGFKTPWHLVAIFKCRQPNICLILRCVSCNLTQPWWDGGLGRESSMKMIG